MASYDRYRPNYKKLYPGIEKIPEILSALQKSDRKIKYMEVDLKVERFIQNQDTNAVVFLPSREDSYDRLCDQELAQFPTDETGPEEAVIHAEDIQKLRAALQQLEPDEAELIHALFFLGLSERQFAKRTGIPAMTIHDRKKRILGKLYKIIENP